MKSESLFFIFFKFSSLYDRLYLYIGGFKMKKFLSEGVNVFMFAYMQELESVLIENKELVRDVKFHDSEANVDSEFKIFLKKIILSEKTKLDLINKNKKIVFDLSGEVISFEYNSFLFYEIRNVFLPSDITKSHINYLKIKDRVFTLPDLLLEIWDGTKIHYRTLELKSTRTNAIPGSSIQQIKPYEWVVFAKTSRNIKSSVDITIGLYINSITSTLQFPDRSPRPTVGFNQLSNWNVANRKITSKEISYSFDAIEEKIKFDLLTDWQLFLAKRWVENVFEMEEKKEPWFNNNLRKFVFLFLQRYEQLSEEEKNTFKEELENLII